MIIGIAVKLLDGSVVGIVPGYVAAVEEIGGWVLPDSTIAPRHAVIVLANGVRYEAAPLDGVPAGTPQSLAMINAINAAIEKIGERLERRAAIAGLTPVGVRG